MFSNVFASDFKTASASRSGKVNSSKIFHVVEAEIEVVVITKSKPRLTSKEKPSGFHISRTSGQKVPIGTIPFLYF
jgi:hypothetical protein